MHDRRLKTAPSLPLSRCFFPHRCPRACRHPKRGVQKRIVQKRIVQKTTEQKALQKKALHRKAGGKAVRRTRSAE